MCNLSINILSINSKKQMTKKLIATISECLTVNLRDCNTLSYNQFMWFSPQGSINKCLSIVLHFLNNGFSSIRYQYKLKWYWKTPIEVFCEFENVVFLSDKYNQENRLKAHTFSGMLYIYKGVAKHFTLVEALPVGSNSTRLNVLYWIFFLMRFNILTFIPLWFT